MKIAVLGAGAMGSIYGGHLSINNDVYMIDKKEELVEKISADGLKLYENDKDIVYYPKALLSSEGIGEVDLVIIFVKALYSRAALMENKAIIGDNTYVLTLQNGAGHEDIIEEFKTYLEDIYLLFEQEYKNVENPDSPENIAHIYGQCRNISIDYGIMEKSAKVYVMKGEFGWSDVGTWHSFHEISPKDENNNVSNSEQVRLIETKECIINVPKDKKVIIEGIENCIIAENNDILMICHRDHEDNIRHFDDILKHTTKEL